PPWPAAQIKCPTPIKNHKKHSDKSQCSFKLNLLFFQGKILQFHAYRIGLQIIRKTPKALNHAKITARRSPRQTQPT
ncbi:hypothetical protein, partial [Pseudomonas fragi]|uniref:hypothetical protein n=1 Tax=Pseudomonas fragi TaxID=296 RepID=UPI001C3C5BDE